MKVRSILDTKGRDVVTIEPDVPLPDAAARMRSADIGALVVVDREGHLLGLLSEREITRVLATAGHLALGMRVAQVMNRTVVSGDVDDDILTLMALMTHARARHVPIVDDHRLVGIVSLGDVVKARLEEVELEVRVLRDLQIARSGA
jgi:CBS domain-containing protein